MKLIIKESKNTFKDKNDVERKYQNYFVVCDNGKMIQVKCAFTTDYDKLSMLVNQDIEITKRQSSQTYKNKGGRVCHYYNYYISNGNGKFVQLRCAYSDDYDRLDMISTYVGNPQDVKEGK